jgi:TPR repeat protein
MQQPNRATLIKIAIHQLFVGAFVLVLSLTNSHGSDIKKGFITRAESGDVEAQFELGSRLLKGWGMAYSPKEAVNWLKQAADKGHVGACYELGFIYENGHGTEPSRKLAYHYYDAAAKAGHSGAHQWLAEKIEYSPLRLKDLRDMIMHYESAAHKSASAIRKLAALLREGILVEKNIERAKELEKLAAIQKAVDKKNYLAEAYQGNPASAMLFIQEVHPPETVSADQLKSFIQSVRLGQDPRLMILFAHYLYQEHKNKDFVDEAIKLADEAESAALKLLDLGYPKAAMDIGKMMMMDGYPSKEKLDPQESQNWLKLAASKGDVEAAKQLDRDAESGELKSFSDKERKMWKDTLLHAGEMSTVMHFRDRLKDHNDTTSLIPWHEVWSKKDGPYQASSLREMAWLYISGVAGYKKDLCKAEVLLQEAVALKRLHSESCRDDLLLLYSIKNSPLFSEEKAKEIARETREIQKLQEHQYKKKNFSDLKRALDSISEKEIIHYICFRLKFRTNHPFEGDGWVGPGVVSSSASPTDSISQKESLRHWLFQSHLLGDKDASWELGMSYLSEEGLRLNKKDAMIYLNAGAQTAEHWTKLAQLYLSDDPEVLNFEKGKYLLEDLSKHGDVDAKFNLAFQLYSGKKLKYDPGRAYELWLDVARSGKEAINRAAQGNLAILFRDGIGVPKNEIESFAWIIQASASGEPSALQERQRLESIFSRELCLLAQQRSAELSELIDRNSADKKKMAAQKEPAKIQTGTGAFVSSSGHVLTAAHVVENTQKVQIIVNSVPHEAKIIQKDKANDIAVLKVDLQSSVHLKVTSGDRIRLGSPIFTLGFPNPDIQGLSPKLTRGEISSINGTHDDPRSWQVSAPVQSGNSGGPLLDLEGRVVGMIQTKLGLMAAQKTGDLPQNVAYAVKGKYLLKILEDCGVVCDAADIKDVDTSFERMVERIKGAVVFIQCY